MSNTFPDLKKHCGKPDCPNDVAFGLIIHGDQTGRAS